MNRKLSAVAVSSLLFTVTCQAIQTEEKLAITASAELGFLYKMGNTKSGDIKTGFNIKFEKRSWLSLLKFDYLYKKTEQETDGNKYFETSDQKWTIDSKTNYALNTNSKNYVYGNVFYEDNRFNGYENQTTASIGWGRHWYKTDKASLYADFGPGFKSDAIREAKDKNGGITVLGETQNAFIIQAQALYLCQINEYVEFKQILSSKYVLKSGGNSIYSAESSIITKLIEALQLKFSLKIDHNTEVAEGTENTDTQTALTLVYSF